jgi:hypothetical protein
MASLKKNSLYTGPPQVRVQSVRCTRAASPRGGKWPLGDAVRVSYFKTLKEKNYTACT